MSPDACSRFNIMQMSSLPLSHVQLKAAIRSDKIMSRAIQLTREGWDHVTENGLLEDLKPYHKRRHELSVEADCLLLGTRVVIPPSLREKIL